MDYTFSINNYTKKLGEEIFVNLNLNRELSYYKTPEDRKNEVEYDYKNYFHYTNTLEIPEGYEVDYLPKGQELKNDFLASTITYAIEENKIVVGANTTEDILELKHKIVTEFAFTPEDDFVEYLLEHRVLWLNSDGAIEEFNKIYLPYSSTSKLEINRARVITKDGKILPLSEENILTAQDEETGRQYKYFAFEGIEKGSFIEYYYVVRKNPDYKGNKLMFQSGIEKSNVEFDLFSPEHLLFKFKSYNDLPAVVMDTLSTGKLHYKLRVAELPKMENEETSAYNASRASVVYKLDQNLLNNSRNISSYGNVAQNIYSYYYPEHPKRSLKKLEDFVSKATAKAGSEEASIVRSLDFYIKANVYLTEGNSDELEDLEKVLDQKVSNDTGLMKLYTASLDLLDIEHEIVLTSNRQEIKFDKEFEANNFLTDFLIYFPDTNSYLSPDDYNSRYGFPPAYLTDNYGLFIKEVTVGGLTTGLGKIQYIHPIAADQSVDQMVINVDFDKEDISSTTINLNRSLAGYYAMYFQPFFNMVNDEDKKELIESFAKQLNEDVEILKKEVVNGEPELFGVKPIQFLLDFKSDAFIERAGNKYLFKVGELIGQQVELYQEKKRNLPYENEFTRSYYRTINIHIPEGYKVVNPEDLVINNSLSNWEEEILSFHSSYELKDNVLSIKADEQYKINIIDTGIYEDYRKVINSAANFNKVTLVLEQI